ncbi:MAG: hypothetical protein KC592_19500 [Nitrospira sp.]|nr:hypothetical protein [Nitrospira sp.]MCW5784388.1 hypothetical protein [Nitrospirales bacterium]
MFMQSAKQVFSRTKYQAAEEDINALARNMALLEGRGLGVLNQRLISANNKIFDTVAEHNVASMLIRHFGESALIEYEPPEHANRPVDFRVQTNANIYWLQMKRFAALKREDMRDRLLDRIKEEAIKIKTPKFFDCELQDEFPKNDLPQLVQFLKETAPTSQEEVQYDYPNSENVKARVQFWDSRNVLLQGLTLGSAGDMSMVNITGLSSEQLRASVRKAAGAFAHAVDSANINLVIAEADRQNDIDVGEACFGSEEEVFSRDSGHKWRRQNNGVFSESNISENVFGLIALRRPDGRKPISNYTMLLYMNDKHDGYLPAIQAAFPIQRVIYYNMRPNSAGYF